MRERRPDWTTWLIQAILTIPCYCFALLYVRRVKGLGALSRGTRRLFVCNHTSLLDTLVFGGILGSRARLPLLVLGDRGTWRRNRVRQFLASRTGFLIERGPFNKARIEELRAFGRSDFHLLVFPEGTRGDGKTVQECHPGIYFVAKAARMPIVPVFIEGMARVSSKKGRFHPLRGLRAVTVHVGAEVLPEEYENLSRAEFTRWVRERIRSAGPPA